MHIYTSSPRLITPSRHPKLQVRQTIIPPPDEPNMPSTAASKATTDWPRALHDALVTAKKVNCVLARLEIPDDSSIRVTFRAVRLAWASTLVSILPSAIISSVRDWLASDSPQAGDVRHDLLSSDFIARLSKDVDAAQTQFGRNAGYAQLAQECDLLLYVSGFVSPPSTSWLHTITHTAQRALRIALPLALGGLGGAAASIPASIAFMSDQSTSVSQAQLNEEARQGLAFFGLLQGMYAPEVSRLTSGHAETNSTEAISAKTLKERIDVVDRHIVAAIRAGEQDKWIRLVGRRQRILFGLLRAIRAVKKRSPQDPTTRNGINRLLTVYRHLPQLESLLQLITMASMMNIPLKQLIHLYGPPGTGKTRFIEDLGEALALPIHTIRITAVKDFEHLLPRTGSFYSTDSIWGSDGATDETICGSILYAILVTGCLNPVIHIDEGSALLSGKIGEGMSRLAINDALKTLFDDTILELRVPSVAPAFRFDFSRVNIVITTNRSLAECGVDPALRSRLTSYHFHRMPTDIKLDATMARIENLDCRTHLTSAQSLLVRLAVANELPRIVARSNDEGHHGVREAIRAGKSVWMLHAFAAMSGQAVDTSKIASIIARQIPSREILGTSDDLEYQHQQAATDEPALFVPFQGPAREATPPAAAVHHSLPNTASTGGQVSLYSRLPPWVLDQRFWLVVLVVILARR
jgi:hypothetical protein